MTGSLLQNYISQAKVSVNPYTTKKADENLTAQTPALTNRAYIKPLPAAGHLVRSNIFDAPATFVKDTNYDVKALKHGLSGKANDHELGKLNDVGMKLGGLAIAAYLFTKRQTPVTKAMEFVGLGSFLASMALWPKIAIQMPAKLIHGMNVQQKYVDSQGRKKPFYQDPQFLPFDMYSSKQINKMGDRMGVDKNMENRRAFIQEKMRKIAIQNNTLWMMTAGVATPVFSALMCNQAEKYIGKYQDKQNIKAADKLMNNFENVAKSRESNRIEKDLENLFELHRDKEVTSDLIKKVSGALSQDLDNEASKGVAADVSKLLAPDGKVVVNDTLAETIQKNAAEAIEKKSGKELAAKAVPTKNAIMQFFEEKGLIGKTLEENANGENIGTVREALKGFFIKNAENAGIPREKAKRIMTVVSAANQESFKASQASILTEGRINALRNVGKVIKGFASKVSVLDEIAVRKAGNVPETALANYWNSFSDDIMEALEIKPKEVEKIRHDRLFAQKFLRNRFEEITSSDEKFEQVIGRIAKKAAELDEVIKPSDDANYIKRSAQVYDDCAQNLAKSGMNETAQQLTTLNMGGKGSSKRIQKEFIDKRVEGVRSAFYRFINTMDTYRRISKGELGTINTEASREIKEELIELAKQTTLQAHTSDHSVKLPFNRNPHPSYEGGDVEIKGGKVVNKFLGKKKGVEIQNDYDFYQKAMKFMFGDNFNGKTSEGLNKAGILDKLNAYKKECLEKFGGYSDFMHPSKQVGATCKASEEYKFALSGVAPDEFLTKAVQKMHNTNKWLKMFGTTAAVLTGVTVLAQFGFGHMKNMPKEK